MIQENKPFGLLIFKMMKTIGNNLKKRLQSAGLNYSLDQLFLLKAVQRDEVAVVQQDMAERVGKDKSCILRIIDSLEEEDLIKRVVNPDDRRKNILVITEKGLILIEKFLTIENELFKDVERGISKNDIDTFYKVIAKIQNNAEQSSPCNL